MMASAEALAATANAICAAVGAGVGPGGVSDMAASPDIGQHRLRRIDVTGLDLHRREIPRRVAPTAPLALPAMRLDS